MLLPADVAEDKSYDKHSNDDNQQHDSGEEAAVGCVTVGVDHDVAGEIVVFVRGRDPGIY